MKEGVQESKGQTEKRMCHESWNKNQKPCSGLAAVESTGYASPPLCMADVALGDALLVERAWGTGGCTLSVKQALDRLFAPDSISKSTRALAYLLK